jgi:hypothetical protein
MQPAKAKEQRSREKWRIKPNEKAAFVAETIMASTVGN